VLEVQWRSTAGDEGPANMEEQGAHEHRGSAGVLSPNLIWSQTGQRVVIDGGVNFGLLPTAMATGVLQAGATEGGDGGAESLQGDDVVLLKPWVRVERLCISWSAEG
jgi:hypothetical protein